MAEKFPPFPPISEEDKKDISEEILLRLIVVGRFLKEKKERIPIQQGSLVYRVNPPMEDMPLEVVNIAEGMAKVVPAEDIKLKNPSSPFECSVEELWDEEDYSEAEDKALGMSPVELKAKITGDYKDPAHEFN